MKLEKTIRKNRLDKLIDKRISKRYRSTARCTTYYLDYVDFNNNDLEETIDLIEKKITMIKDKDERIKKIDKLIIHNIDPKFHSVVKSLPCYFDYIYGHGTAKDCFEKIEGYTI